MQIYILLLIRKDFHTIFPDIIVHLFQSTDKTIKEQKINRNLFGSKNVVRIFANRINHYGRKERIYSKTRTTGTLRQSIGPSGTNSHTALSGRTENLLFRRHQRGTAHCQGYRITTPEGTERRRTHSG